MLDCRSVCRISVACAVSLLFTTAAWAVPSFARQTGLNCSACHINFPQLTAFGRNFKLHGYTQTRADEPQTNELHPTAMPPLSVMFQVSFSKLSAAEPDTQNGTLLFPDQFSLFYAGRISGRAGAFVQVTYDGPSDHFSMDNADIRLVGSHGSIIAGLNANNNPTVEDLWNSTPAWGFPFTSSSIAPGPAAAAQVDGTLGQQVAGIGGYATWKNMVYGDVTFYRSFQIGSEQPPTSASSQIIDGVAPYWRLAAYKTIGNHDVEVGAYGLVVNRFPGNGQPLSGPTDRLVDTALDGQYQYLSGPNALTARATYIHERQRWDASFPAAMVANPEDTLNTSRVNATYLYERKVGGSLGVFSLSGDADTLLYPPGDLTGSATGAPDSRGWVAELLYFPWQNTRFAVQWVRYSKFNGADINYDGSGRAASANNTLFLNAWLMW
jgi:hypothetical protein